MSIDKGCAPGKSSLIGLGSARDYDGCAILQYSRMSIYDKLNIQMAFHLNFQLGKCYLSEQRWKLAYSFLTVLPFQLRIWMYVGFRRWRKPKIVSQSNQ